ncbi:unnamed protein product [Pleuronectes platessa]|uniref:Uncharacterized protein n=1 Tax=Pleuronectes platessa TaxID=8262 RepID=A0A9N7Z3T7_PLEPL|nr:unnamed protein product [Pleuronectes platessa]
MVVMVFFSGAVVKEELRPPSFSPHFVLFFTSLILHLESFHPAERTITSSATRRRLDPIQALVSVLRPSRDEGREGGREGGRCERRLKGRAEREKKEGGERTEPIVFRIHH